MGMVFSLKTVVHPVLLNQPVSVVARLQDETIRDVFGSRRPSPPTFDCRLSSEGKNCCVSLLLLLLQRLSPATRRQNAVFNNFTASKFSSK